MNKITNYIIGGVAILALVMSLVGVGGNNQSSLEKKIDSLETAFLAFSDNVGLSLGASGSRFPNGISADSTSPSAGQVRGTTLTMTGESYLKGLTSGNGTLASTTVASTGTLTEQEMLDNSIIDILSNTSVTFALTLPATSTMTTLLPAAGDMRSWMIQNASTTAGVALTITKGAGIDLIGVDTNVDVIDGAEWSVLNCYRKVDTDVVCEVSELVHVD